LIKLSGVDRRAALLNVLKPTAGAISLPPGASARDYGRAGDLRAEAQRRREVPFLPYCSIDRKLRWPKDRSPSIDGFQY
jgi:hypothetical protein